MASVYNIKGTSQSEFQVGKHGPKLVKSGGDLEIQTPDGALIVSELRVAGTTLAEVATSGSYNDLLNKPTIPSILDNLTDVVITSVSDGDALIYDSGTSKWVNAVIPGGGGPIDLDDLNDVVITSVADGDSIVYDSGTGKWINAPVSGGGGAIDLDDLTDVTITTPLLDQVLQYTGSTWINATFSPGASTLDGLSDVVVTSPANNQYLRYNSGTTSWVNSAISYSHISGTPSLATVATTGAYSDLTGTPVIGTDVQAYDGDLAAIAAIVGTTGLLKKTAANTWSLDTTAYAPLASPTFTGTVSGISAAMVGLGNVDNTSDANKPVSTATQTALNLKAPLASPTFTGTVSGITKSMVGLANVDNTSDANKPVSTATQTALNLKADISSLAAVATAGTFASLTSKPTTVSGYGITDAVTTDMLGADNGVATLDADGKIPSSQLSAIAITQVYTVSSQVDQLALDTHEGDIVIRTDLNKTYIRNNGTTGTMSDYSEMLTPTDSVVSVNGYTGTVSLTKSDVGLGNVDNTSDANKPVSSATQTALNLKANLASPTFTGTVGGITATMVGLGNVDNTSDANKPISSATQTALNAKQATLVSGTNIKTINSTTLLGSGNIVLSTVATLDDLTDVVISSPTNTQLLRYNGTNWVNATAYTVPAGGATNQALVKSSATDGATTWATVLTDTTTIYNGTSNISIATSGGNISLNPTGVSGVLVASSTGVAVTGTFTTSSSVTVGSGTGGSITGADLVSANSLQGTITTGAQPNITSVGTLTGVVTSGYVIASSATGIVAAGSTQGTATAIAAQFNAVSSVAASTGVILPTLVAGMRITIINLDAVSLNVYPPSGNTINALSTNNPFVLTTGSIIDFCAMTSTQWYTK